MKVIIADCAGFCFGVERAIKLVYDARNNHENVVTFGPIIHNPQAVENLKRAGILAKDSLDEISNEMTAVIRTHGAGEKETQELKTRAQAVLDATCPFVKKAQSAAAELSDAGYSVVVVGEDDHPEVLGIVSYIKGEYFNAPTVEEAKKLPSREKYGIMAQTTQNEKIFDDIIDAIKSKADEVKIVNTICNATHKRQDAALSLAGKADVMIIVGGRNSANTTRLFQLCKKVCGRVYHIETVDELTPEMYAGAEIIGISAGASTPNEIINQVKEYILENKK